MYILNYENLTYNLDSCINSILENINYNDIIIYSMLNINDIIISILNNIDGKESKIVTKENEEYINFKKVEIESGFFSVNIIFNNTVEKNIKILSTSNPNFINNCKISIIQGEFCDYENEFFFENYKFLFSNINIILFYNPIPFNKYKRQIYLKNWLQSIEEIENTTFCNSCNLPLLGNKCYFCCKEYDNLFNQPIQSLLGTETEFLNILLTDSSVEYLPVQKSII